MKENINSSSHVSSQINNINYYLSPIDISSVKKENTCVLESVRNKELYHKYEMFCTKKNKFKLNNNYDANNCKEFLKDKEKCLEEMHLDDKIIKKDVEDEDEKIAIDVSNDKINKNIDNTKSSNQENTIVSHTNYYNHNNLFDTGKGDLLSLVVGLGK